MPTRGKAGNCGAILGFACITAANAVEVKAMLPWCQPRQIGIDHHALIGVLRCDAADRLASAVAIDALQCHLQGSAPAGCDGDQADEQKELSEQATHHRTACS